MSSIKQSLIQFIPPFDSYFMHFLPFKHLPEVYRPSLSSLLGTREIARKQARVSESALCVWGEGGGGVISRLSVSCPSSAPLIPELRSALSSLYIVQWAMHLAFVWRSSLKRLIDRPI